jgi:hypothetical protein
VDGRRDEARAMNRRRARIVANGREWSRKDAGQTACERGCECAALRIAARNGRAH